MDRLLRSNWLHGVLLGLVLVAAVFPGAFFGTESLVPAAALRGDPVYRDAFPPGGQVRTVWDMSGLLVHYPAQTVAAHELRAGHAPLWSPYVGAGAPLLAEAHSAPLSPLLLPFWLSPSETTWSWHLLLRVVLAAAATYVVARRNLGRPASALVAVAYAVGGMAATRFDLPTEGSAYAWLPVCVLAARRAAALPRPGLARWSGVAVLGLAVGATIYSAHPELALLCAVGGALVVGMEAPRDVRRWARLGGGIVVGGVIGAAAILPLVEYVLGGGASYKTDPHLAAMFVSDLVYPPTAPQFLRLGAPVLVLAGTAWAWRATEATRSLGRALLLTLVLTVSLVALQAWGPAGMAGLVPPRYTLFVVVFVATLLAGHGLEALADGALARRGLVGGAFLGLTAWVGLDALTWGRLHRVSDVLVGDAVGAVALVLAMVYLSRAATSTRSRGHVAWLVVLVTTAALGVSAARTVRGATGSVGLDRPRAIPETQAARAVASLHLDASPDAGPPPRIAGLGHRLDHASLTPNVATLDGVADVRAVAAIFPGRYRAYMELVDGVATQPTSTLLEHARSPLLALLGVTHVVDERGQLVAQPGAAPRAFLADEILPAAGLAEAQVRLRELARAGRLPGAVVVEGAPLPPLAAAQGQVSITAYEPRRVELRVDVTQGPALLVLTDTFAPGWKASLDDHDTAIHPVDVLFRGVAVPPGRHTVIFRYEPLGFAIGWPVALAAALLCLGLIVAGRRDLA